MKSLLAAICLVVLASSCSGAKEGSHPAAAPISSGQVAAPSVQPPTSPAAALTDIRFVLDESYPAGQRISVQIENVGDVAYEYHTPYEACELIYRDAIGRTFIIPPGTHCDMITTVLIRPGETKTLFKWDLDECTKDRWGCVRSRPLDPGTYSISGSFKPADGGSSVPTEATFTITEA
jgi:hypothetical protein